MSGNLQNKLGKARNKPRVHITLDLKTETKPQKALPFVIGVMGDFSGRDIKGEPLQAPKAIADFREREFVDVDRDNFDKVMSEVNPVLTIRVANKLSDDNSNIPVELSFRSMRDFDPARIAEQVKPLRDLMAKRAKLRDLLARADRSVKLEGLLEQLLKDTESRKVASKETTPHARKV